MLPSSLDFHLDVVRTRHPLVWTTRLYALLRVPAYTAVSCDCVPPPPLFRHWPSTRSLSDAGGFAYSRSLCLPCAPASPSLSALLPPEIFWFLTSLGWLFTRGQGARANPLSVSCSSWSLILLLLGHSSTVHATQLFGLSVIGHYILIIGAMNSM